MISRRPGRPADRGVREAAPPVVVVENNIIYINIIVGARVARMVYFLLFFTTHSATHVLKTIVLAGRRHA